LLKNDLRNETVKANCKAKAPFVMITNIFLKLDLQRYKKSQRTSIPKWTGKKTLFRLKCYYFHTVILTFTTISDNYLSLQLTFRFIFNVQRSLVGVIWNIFLYFKLKYWHKINWINFIKSTYSAYYINVDDLVRSIIVTVLIQVMKLGVNSTFHEITCSSRHQWFSLLLAHLIFSSFSILFL
jgi:hypothetical protein